MEIKMKNIEEIIPYDNNPRINDNAVQEVANSIREFGFKVPIVLDKNNVIINGHTRLKASKLLGLKEVPAIFADDLSEDKIKAFRLADNKTGELADWDLETLGIELNSIDMNMEQFGFELEPIDNEDDNGIIEDDYEADEKMEVNVSKGDIYILGDHRLMCGDSLNSDDLENLLDFNKIDLLLTDPPYNIDYNGQTSDSLKMKNDNMDDQSYLEFITTAFKNSVKHMKNNGSIYVWFSQLRSDLFYSAIKDASLKIRQQLIWSKNGFTMGKPYRNQYEPCLFATLNDEYNWYSDNSQSTVLKFDRPQINKEHPTMKPVSLFDYQIRNSSKVNDNVLDIFGGSGTTIIACEQNKRNAFLMELDPFYCQVIINRWEEFTGNKAKKIERNN
ncbi:MAG: hypothetical protein [Caudoviricetes sp.]|nr:MAG: hypothetical protein [Caudoviricetes sp.]